MLNSDLARNLGMPVTSEKHGAAIAPPHHPRTVTRSGFSVFSLMFPSVIRLFSRA